MKYVCSVCGTEAMADSRGGAIDHILMCGCDNRGIWINDGRGGFWQPSNNARVVTHKQYLESR